MYKSPLHILSGWNEDPSLISTPGYLLRLRKELLAEFNLNNSTTLEIGSATYSKDEIIKTIDQLLDNPNLPLHTFIFANKNLLNFLEDDHSEIRADFLGTLVIPEERSATLLPLISERLVYRLKKAFFSRDFFQVKEVVSSWPQGDEESTLQFYDQIHRNIVTIISEIETLPSYNIDEMPEELHYLKKKEVSTFLNALPEDFSTTRDSFVSAVTNSLVAYQNSHSGHDKNYNYCVSQMLVEVNCSEHLQELVRKNHEVFSKKFQGSGSSGEWSVGRIGYFIVIAIIALSRFSTCNQSSSSSYTAPIITSYSSPGNTYDPATDLSSYKISDLNVKEDKFVEEEQVPIAIETAEIEPDKETYNSYEEENFKRYRNAILENQGNLYEFYGRKVPEPITASLNGHSPFSSFLKYFPYKHEGVKKLRIDNRTKHQLVVVAIATAYSKAAFFFPNKPDTFSFLPGSRFYFYFGDSLVRNLGLSSLSEVYFKNINKEALTILSKTYLLDFKTKKINPTLTLTNSFLEKGKLENSQLKLSLDTLKEKTD